MLLIKAINLVFLAMIFAMPIMYPNAEIAEIAERTDNARI